MNDSPTTPSLTDLSLLAETAHYAEKVLNSWLQAKSRRDPSIEEINQATRALWRLTSVRKTLLELSAQTEAAKPKPPPTITDEEIKELIRGCEEKGLDIIDDDDDDYDNYNPLHVDSNPVRLKNDPIAAPPAEPPAQRSVLAPRVTSIPVCPSIPCIPGLAARLIFEPISKFLRLKVERKRVWRGGRPKESGGVAQLRRALFWPTTKSGAFAADRSRPKEGGGIAQLRRALFWPTTKPRAFAADRTAFALAILNILRPPPPYPRPARAPT